MRPHRLGLEAFGPFADPVEVELDELALDGLFLIHGPTGAGKTFLLDAMCFALYGEVPGARGVHSLKSDHAEPRATPRVTLEFSAQGDRFVVERTPTHTVPKSRGEGTTSKPGSANLARLDGTSRVPVASSLTEVRREIERLVGLDASQFQQVILLPQGRFEQVLRADSSDREKLLKTLFDTVLYEQATEWLDAHAKEAGGRATALEESLVVLRSQATRHWAPFAALGACLLGGAPSEVAEEGTLDDQPGLDALVAHLDTVQLEARDLVAGAERARRAAQQHQQQTDALATRWDRRAEARLRVARLAEQRDEMDLEAEALARAERAERLRSSLEAEQTSRELLIGLHAGIDEQLASLRSARGAAVALPEAAAHLELATLPPPALITEVLGELAAHRARLDELCDKAADATAKETLAAAARQRAEDQQGLVRRATTESVAHRDGRGALIAALEGARRCRDQVPGLQLVALEARARAEAAAALVSARALASERGRAATDAERVALDTRRVAQDLRERYLDGIAATLAGALSAGHACPVCGSTTHPDPAVAAPGAVTREALDASEAAADDAEGIAGVAAASAVEIDREVAALESRIATGGGEATGDAAAVAARTASAAAAAASDLADASDQAGRLEELEGSLAELEERLARLEPVIAEALEVAATESQAAVGAAEEAAALRLAIAASLGDGVAPEEALDSLTPFLESLRGLAHGAGEVVTAAARHSAAADHLDGELAASPFEDASAARRALRDEAARAEISRRIRDYGDDVVKQQGILEAPDLADLPDVRPDMTAALGAVTEAEQAHTTAVEHRKAASIAQGELTRLAAEHRAGEEALVALQGHAELANAVANRCSGRTPPRVSLQRWVLGAFLEEICGHANERLELMTSGRYRMRVHAGGEPGGRQAGLGLRVLDAFTGEDREVSTLSGGETFQASLALALGVADAVQARSGGVRLDALFIDEGFGTLDPDNLQLAMDELDRLREGGRMVGIISHVATLRERIGYGIEVLPTDHGSTLRVGATETA